MKIQQETTDRMAAAVKTAGQALADTITIAFAPVKARNLRRDAEKLLVEADAIDARVAEAKARMEARRGE